VSAFNECSSPFSALVAKYPALFNWFDKVVVYIFTVELALKIFGEQYKPWKYFMNKWNCFDFVIVVVSYASGSGSLLTMLRLVRLLRALKLIRQLPQLQVHAPPPHLFRIVKMSFSA
jgi:voltage-gated sodium channel